jgi:hypothetical protein
MAFSGFTAWILSHSTQMKSLHSLLALMLVAVLLQNAPAGGVFHDPRLLFPNSLLPALSQFEKVKIETTLRGFYLRADTHPGFKDEQDPSDAGLYLNVAASDPEEITKFSDTSKVANGVTERVVEFPGPGNGQTALRLVFKFGARAGPEAIKAIGDDIEAIIKQANTDLSANKLVDEKPAARAEVVLRVKRLSAGTGSKYLWFPVEVIKVFKNTSGEGFEGRLSVAAYSVKDGVPEGESTLYLDRYDETEKGLRKLVGGEATTGASHVK